MVEHGAEGTDRRPVTLPSVAKDPGRIARRTAAAAELGITEDELRARRADEDARNLEVKAAAAGVSVARYLQERRRRRNQGRNRRSQTR